MPYGATYNVVVCVPAADVQSGEWIFNVGPGSVTCDSASPHVLVPVMRQAYLVDVSQKDILESQLAGTSLFQLTPEDGALIGGAILGVWAVAWGFRMLIRHFNSVDEGVTHVD